MALLAARLDYEPAPTPAKMQWTFDAGHSAEEDAVRILEERGYKIIDRQMQVRLPITKTVFVEGHIDGHFCVDKRSTSIVEIKSQSPDEWATYERGQPGPLWVEKYPWQFSAYGHACSLPVDVVRINRETLRIEIERWEPLIPVEEIRARVLQVEAAARRGVLDLPCTGGFPCPYYYLHEEPEAIEDATVDVLARQYKVGKRIEAVGKEKAEIAKRQLRSAVETLVPGGLKVQTQSAKVTFFASSRVSRIQGMNDPDDPFKLVSEWENVRITVRDED